MGRLRSNVERLLRSCLTGRSRHREVVCLCDTREEGQRSRVLNAKKPMQGRSLTLTLASTGGLWIGACLCRGWRSLTRVFGAEFRALRPRHGALKPDPGILPMQPRLLFFPGPQTLFSPQQGHRREEPGAETVGSISAAAMSRLPRTFLRRTESRHARRRFVVRGCSLANRRLEAAPASSC